NQYGGVFVFRFDEDHRLRSVARASSASIDAANRWRLENYQESRIEEDRVIPRRAASEELQTNLSAEFLGLAALSPEALTGRDLWGYVMHLRANGLDARQFETAFWARIARTMAVASTAVRGVPLPIGPARYAGAGGRPELGVLIG